jgi:hypothetical protein
MVGANTVNGPLPCKVTPLLSMPKTSQLLMLIPVIVLSSGGVIVIITAGGCKDGKKDNQSKIFVFNKVFMIFMFKCFNQK